MIENKIQWIKDRPHLCVSPYNNYDYRIQQEKLKITVCCNLDTTYTELELDNEFINSLQTDIENKKLPAACHLCGTIEKNGAQSERIKYLIDFSPEQLIKFEQDKKPTDLQVGMKFSNRCNLACRSCNSFDSSYWSEKMRVPSEPRLDVDISDNDMYWQQMTAMILDKHSQTDNFILHPIGGETMLQAGFIKLLDWMIDQGLAATTSIRITTSLVVNLEELRDKLLQFRNIFFLASIDSINENYHYVRWPAKFSKVQSSLDEFLYVRKNYPGKYDLLITPVFSLNNIFYIVEWLDYWYNWCNENNIEIWLQTTHINRPMALMVESLPLEYRPQLISILQTAVAHPFFTKYVTTKVQHEYFKSMLLLLQSTQVSPRSIFDDYLKFSADYDKRTGTNSFVLNSKLYGLLSHNDQQTYYTHFNNTDITLPVYDIDTGLSDLN